MNDYGLVSIVMPTYNSAEFIRESIQSVQNQTYPNWELIVVDDFSTDRTEEFLWECSMCDKRVRYYKLDENSGAAVARNYAMNLANGKYMAFLDSDDLWCEEKLEKQLFFMQTKGISFSNTAYEQIDEKGNILGKVIPAIRKTDYNRMLLDCPVGNSTVMYNVDLMGKFRVPNIRKRNDDALWLQMLKKEQYIYGLSEILMQYRVRSNSISSNKLSLVKYHWILYRDIEKLSIARSVFHILYWILIKIFRKK